MKKRLAYKAVRRYKTFLATLAHDKRFAVLHLLLEQGPLNVSQIVRETGFNQATVSRNLRRLASCQYVFSKKNGKQRIYSLNEETIVPIMKFVDNHVRKYCAWYC